MNYIKFVFDLDDQFQETFIAELIEIDFYGFEQFDKQLVAYVEKPRFKESNRGRIEQLIGSYPGGVLKEMEEIEEQNWNETWEKTIQPQKIGRFLVRPTWSDRQPEPGEIVLEIDPKMSFGTGYHATTRLMLRQLGLIDFTEKSVLDAGTGTGILAIASVKLGAGRAVGFDHDSWSRENAVENALINNVKEYVEIRYGGIGQVGENERFDICLANINRNVILEIIKPLVKFTKPGGDICLSGLLNSDEEKIREHLGKQPVDIADLKKEDEWILFHLKKRVDKN